MNIKLNTLNFYLGQFVFFLRVILLFLCFTIHVYCTTDTKIFGNIRHIVTTERVKKTCFIMYAENQIDLPKIEEIIGILDSVGLVVFYARKGDKGGLAIGGNINDYMRKGIMESDYIFTLYSKDFFEKSKCPFSGISIEIQILLERLRKTDSETSFFIPVILSGEIETSIPYVFRSILAIKGQSEKLTTEEFIENLLPLLRNRIYNECREIREFISAYQESLTGPFSVGSSFETILMSTQSTAHSQSLPNNEN